MEPPHSSFSIQAKLTIGQPDDPYEKEADKMAEKAFQDIPTNSITQQSISHIQLFAQAGALPAPNNLQQQLQAKARN